MSKSWLIYGVFSRYFKTLIDKTNPDLMETGAFENIITIANAVDSNKFESANKKLQAIITTMNDLRSKFDVVHRKLTALNGEKTDLPKSLDPFIDALKETIEVSFKCCKIYQMKKVPKCGEVETSLF